jgi:hypothetical protein
MQHKALMLVRLLLLLLLLLTLHPRSTQHINHRRGKQVAVDQLGPRSRADQRAAFGGAEAEQVIGQLDDVQMRIDATSSVEIIGEIGSAKRDDRR